jgi:hypothetical protein
MTILKVVKDEVVVDYGDIGNEFFIIMEGYVEIHVPLPVEFHVSLNNISFARQSVKRKGMIADDQEADEI